MKTISLVFFSVFNQERRPYFKLSDKLHISNFGHSHDQDHHMIGHVTRNLWSELPVARGFHVQLDQSGRPQAETLTSRRAMAADVLAAAEPVAVAAGCSCGEGGTMGGAALF